VLDQRVLASNHNILQHFSAVSGVEVRAEDAAVAQVQTVIVTKS